ncbi:MAG: hypothetical protein OEZ59_00760 [Deltaproteobacteria bacterium]|nr:hypothetical protein [Deltaproteobacteria bacterium]
MEPGETTWKGLLKQLTAMLALAALLASFLPSCTRTVPRAPVREDHYRVNWEQLEHTPLRQGGLVLRPLIMTPTRYPLEASFKRMLELDIAGVWEGMDFRFHSSTIPDGALERLYDEGYLPVYLQVSNPGEKPLVFNPDRLSVGGGGDVYMYPVKSAELPPELVEVDVEKTVISVLAAALIVVLVVAAAKDGKSPRGDLAGDVLNLGARVSMEATTGTNRTVYSQGAPPPDEAAASRPGPEDSGILTMTEIAPGESREGFLLFRYENLLIDWDRVRLVAH